MLLALVISVAFVPPPMGNLGPALVALACTLSGVFGLGCAFAALTLLIHESAQAMAGVVQFALLVLCSMLVPFHSLPPLLRTVSQCIPLSYCVDLFRSAMMGYSAGYPELAPVTTELVIAALWGVGMPLGGLWLYQRRCAVPPGHRSDSRRCAAPARRGPVCCCVTCRGGPITTFVTVTGSARVLCSPAPR